MIEIKFTGWGNPTTSLKETMQLFTPDPVRSLGSSDGRGVHLTCTALQNFHLNAFTVFSPYSTKFTFNRETKQVTHSGDNILNQATFNPDGTIELQTYPQYIFISESESVILQMLPPLLVVPKHPSYVTAGEFDISKWYRPVNCTFIIPPGTDQIEIKEGDPLFSLRFVTKNNEPVKLVKSQLTETEEKLVNACQNVTYVKLGNSLSKLYDYFENFKNSFSKPKKKSRCPFHR